MDCKVHFLLLKPSLEIGWKRLKLNVNYNKLRAFLKQSAMPLCSAPKILEGAGYLAGNIEKPACSAIILLRHPRGWSDNKGLARLQDGDTPLIQLFHCKPTFDRHLQKPT